MVRDTRISPKSAAESAHDGSADRVAPEAAEDQGLVLPDLHPGVEPADPVDERDPVAKRAGRRGHDRRPLAIGQFDLVIDVFARSIVKRLQGRLVPVVDLPRIYADVAVAEDPGHGVPVSPFQRNGASPSYTLS